MPVKAIYWIHPKTGARADIHLFPDGCYVLVDARLPYRAADGTRNWRNMKEVAVRVPSLDRAAQLVEELGYRPRVLVNGKPNYVPAQEVNVER